MGDARDHRAVPERPSDPAVKRITHSGGDQRTGRVVDGNRLDVAAAQHRAGAPVEDGHGRLIEDWPWWTGRRVARSDVVEARS